MTPVKPIPPAVAQKSSGSSRGLTVYMPVGVITVRLVTWAPKLPSR